jgi:hypothetical protein
MKAVVVTAFAQACEELFEAGRTYERHMCVEFLREMAEILPEEDIVPRSAIRALVRTLESLAQSIENMEHVEDLEEETLQ